MGYKPTKRPHSRFFCLFRPLGSPLLQTINQNRMKLPPPVDLIRVHICIRSHCYLARADRRKTAQWKNSRFLENSMSHKNKSESRKEEIRSGLSAHGLPRHRSQNPCDRLAVGLCYRKPRRADRFASNIV